MRRRHSHARSDGGTDGISNFRSYRIANWVADFWAHRIAHSYYKFSAQREPNNFKPDQVPKQVTHGISILQPYWIAYEIAHSWTDRTAHDQSISLADWCSGKPLA